MLLRMDVFDSVVEAMDVCDGGVDVCDEGDGCV